MRAALCARDASGGRPAPGSWQFLLGWRVSGPSKLSELQGQHFGSLVASADLLKFRLRVSFQLAKSCIQTRTGTEDFREGALSGTLEENSDLCSSKLLKVFTDVSALVPGVGGRSATSSLLPLAAGVGELWRESVSGNCVNGTG